MAATSKTLRETSATVVREIMSDIGLKFPLWVYFFIPPIILADALGWLTAPLAIALAVAWLAFWRRWLDVTLLALALISAVGVTWTIVPVSGAGLVIAGCANFVWFAAILLPIRWIVTRFLPGK